MYTRLDSRTTGNPGTVGCTRVVGRAGFASKEDLVLNGCCERGTLVTGAISAIGDATVYPRLTVKGCGASAQHRLLNGTAEQTTQGLQRPVGLCRFSRQGKLTTKIPSDVGRCQVAISHPEKPPHALPLRSPSYRHPQETDDPLTKRYIGNYFIGQQGGGLGHPAGAAAGTESTLLAGKGNEALEMAALLEITAGIRYGDTGDINLEDLYLQVFKNKFPQPAMPLICFEVIVP